MNCKDANRIPIVGYLASQGISPVSVKNEKAWFLSPFRSETKPSFKVNRELNLWFDFGTGENGTLIDLVCKLTGSSVPGALLHLQRPELMTQTITTGRKINVDSPRIIIQHIQPLENEVLIKYLLSRGINEKLGAYYLKEVYYTISKNPNQVKPYFALGFKNDNDGYELRSKNFKGCTSKAITTIFGHDNSQVNVFEGFFDFLTAIVYPGLKILTYDNIVLNSINNLSHIKTMLSEYDKINLFLDNDQPGRKIATGIKTQFRNVTNYSERIYPYHKDFNEFLMPPDKSNK